MKKILKKKATIVMTVIMALSFTFVAFNHDNKAFEISKSITIYVDLFKELNTFYVDQVETQKLLKTSIDKMLESLDPYTNYIPEEDIEDFRFMTTGEYAGIGALISRHGDEIIVSEPYEGFPAQKGGLKAGDVFLEIDGKSVKGLEVSDVSNMLKGPANKKVIIKVERPGLKKPLKIEVVRKKISIDPVSYYGMLDDKTGYIRLSNFTMDCGEKVKRAFLELKEAKGAEQLIFDLRGNPGGLLNEAVKITNIWIPQGQEIVSTKGKVKKWDKTYRAPLTPVDTTMPMVVLVNRGSASASEIVSGALQDLDRAVVIGTRTFGKGLVQTTRDLSYNAKLKLTTAKYYIPSGRCIQALDYSHRNEDGSVGKIPDSLITEFSTNSGRKVFDGGGVMPDIEIDLDKFGKITYNLVREFMVFDFATLYANQHKSIDSPEKFEITEEIYSEFKDYLKQQDFTYTSESEEEMKELIESAKEERYYEHNKELIAELKKAFTPDMERDLETFEDEIKDILKDEIVTRFYYQKGAVRSALIDDKGILKAIDILGAHDRYEAMLVPQPETEKKAN